MRWLWVSALLVATAGCADDGPDPPAPLHFEASGFYRTAEARGRSWLVTPEGEPFYSLGVNHVTANPDTDQKTGECPYCAAVAKNYASKQAWADATVQRLESWGFNTVGAWSD